MSGGINLDLAKLCLLQIYYNLLLLHFTYFSRINIILSVVLSDPRSPGDWVLVARVAARWSPCPPLSLTSAHQQP